MSNNPDGKTDCNFLKKLLPETANEIDEHSLKIIYNREEGKPTIIGKKNLEEVLSDYYAFMKKL